MPRDKSSVKTPFKAGRASSMFCTCYWSLHISHASQLTNFRFPQQRQQGTSALIIEVGSGLTAYVKSVSDFCFCIIKRHCYFPLTRLFSNQSSWCAMLSLSIVTYRPSLAGIFFIAADSLFSLLVIAWTMNAPHAQLGTQSITQTTNVIYAYNCYS